MLGSLQRIHSDNQKASDRGKGWLINKYSEQNNFRTSSEISEVPFLDWRYSDQRHAFLTLLALDGCWRLFALPMRCFDQHNQLGASASMNVDGLCLVSGPSINAFSFDPLKALKGPQPDRPHNTKLCTIRKYPSIVRYQSQNKASANKVTRSNEFYGDSSCQSSVTCIDSYDLIAKGCSTINSPNAFTNNSNVVKAVKKNSRKKTRRNGKEKSKISSDTVSIEPELLSECAHGSSTSDTCFYIDKGEELVSYASTPEVSLPDGSIDKIDLDVDTNRFNCSAALETFTANIDEVDIVEATISSLTGDHQVINSEVGIDTKEERFSILDGGLAVKNPVQISCCDDIHSEHSKSFSDMPDPIVLDVVSLGSYSDDSPDANHCIKLLDKESSRVRFSEAPVLRKGHLSPENSLIGAVDKYDHSDGIKCGDQNFSGSDAQLPVPSKRSRQTKTLARSCSAYKFGCVGNFHGRNGKENNHSVWQKVQKNVADDICELKKVPICSQFDVTLKEMASLKRNCNVADVDAPSQTKDKKRPKDKVSKKLKRKNSLCPKQEYSIHNRRGSHPNKVNLTAHAKSSKQQDKMLDISGQVTDKKGVRPVTRSHSRNGCPIANLQTNGAECVNSEPLCSLQVFPDASGPLKSSFDAVSTVQNHHSENQDSSLPKSYNSLDENMLRAQPPVCLPHLLSNKVSQIEKEGTLEEYCKQNHGSGSVLQKWIPIGVKDPKLINSAEMHNFGEDWTLNTEEEKVASKSQHLGSSLILGMALTSENANCISHDNVHTHKLRNSTAWLPEHNMNVVAGRLISESKVNKYSVFEVETNKIIQAVNDACRVQQESEAVQVAAGGPIAEFERVLYVSSPVICPSPGLSCCKICSQDKLVGMSLCKHKMPNSSLGCLWQWYEKHGNYGLEVRAEDYKSSKRFGVDRFSFRAYFVPFLSAVQLFKDCSSQPIKNSNTVPGPWVLDTCEMSERVENSNVGSLLIFPVLVPQPHVTNATQSVDITCSDDAELLFEYFESDQPQQRRPLYEKIQELVRGDGSSASKMYGDPMNLVSVNLHDLHPRSWSVTENGSRNSNNFSFSNEKGTALIVLGEQWYSVAWYPIYRIPDGDFRAAFLTYHLLGHSVHRNAKFDSLSVDTCVVSPVVGLQSCNAQSECWFQLRPSAVSQTSEIPSLNLSGILKERLRTLEETASLMARAVVSKGNQTSVNRHPDYEFFLSRRGY